MKKYFLTSAAALAFCGLFTSCTHDFDNDGGSAAQNSVMKTYEQAFITAFGQPDPNQEWGFGTSTVATSRAMTRAASIPSKPIFRDGNKVGDEIIPPISKPTKPSVYNTVAEAKEAGVAVIDARGQELNADHNKTYWVNSGTKLWQLDGRDNITVYVDDDMTFNMGFSANRNTLVITEGKKVKLGTLNENVTVYLAPRAELELTQDLTFNNNWDWKNVKKDDVLYLSRSSKLTGDFSMTITNGYKVCNDGGTISTKNLTLDNQDSELWNNGTITVTEELFFNNEMSHLYNAPNNKITAKTLRLINNEHLLYNDGTVNISGNITMTNNSAEIINNDSLICAGNLDMTAGGKFHNVGDATITGTTYLYNTNSEWENDGHFTTGTFSDQNCEKVFNNCYMTVTGTFYLGMKAGANGHGYFCMEGGGEREDESGAYVKCDSFTFGGNTDLFMGNKSFIEVVKDFKSTNDNDTYGIHGPASGSYAVIKAANFTKEGNPYISMTYYGNLYIDTETHYPKGTDNANPYYVYDTSVKFSFKDENFSVKIPKTECSPGYNNDDDDDDDDDDSDPNAIRVICEDLSVTQASDWDFNDVVFDVKLVENNSKVEITLRAAGGTLLLTVAGREVHELFKEKNPTFAITSGTMVSTGPTNSTGKYRWCGADGIKAPKFTIDNDFNTNNVKEIARAIPVQVYKLVNGERDWYDIEWKKGDPSARIGVGTDYDWCDERVNIKDCFRANSTSSSGDSYSTFQMYVDGDLTESEGVNAWYNVKVIE